MIIVCVWLPTVVVWSFSNWTHTFSQFFMLPPSRSSIGGRLSSAEYMAWSKRSVVNDAKNAASDITSRLSSRNLSGLKAGFDRLTITDSSICRIDPRNNEYLLQQVEKLGWDRFIYMPYMYQQIMEVFAYGDKVINLIKAKQKTQCP